MWLKTHLIYHVLIIPIWLISWVRLSVEEGLQHQRGFGLVQVRSPSQGVTRESRLRECELDIRQQSPEARRRVPSDPGRRRQKVKPGRPSLNVTRSEIKAMLSSTVNLQCFIDSFPKATNFWLKGEDRIYPGNEQYKVTQDPLPHFEFRDRLGLRITKLDISDVSTSFRCVSTNKCGVTTKEVRIALQEHFNVTAGRSIIYANRGTDITLECEIRAFPLTITYWINSTGYKIRPSPKYSLTAEVIVPFHYKARLRIRNLGNPDFSSYKCVTRNTFEEKVQTFRIIRIQPGPSKTKSSGSVNLVPQICSYILPIMLKFLLS